MFCKLPVAASKVVRIILYIIFGILLVVTFIGLVFVLTTFSVEKDEVIPAIVAIETFMILAFFLLGLSLIIQCILIGFLYHQEGACMNPTQLKILLMGIPTGLLVLCRIIKEVSVFTHFGNKAWNQALAVIEIFAFNFTPAILLLILMWPVVKVDKEKEEVLLDDFESAEEERTRPKLKSQKLPNGVTDDDLASSDSNRSLRKALNQYEDDSKHREKRKWFSFGRE